MTRANSPAKNSKNAPRRLFDDFLRINFESDQSASCRPLPDASTLKTIHDDVPFPARAQDHAVIALEWAGYHAASANE